MNFIPLEQWHIDLMPEKPLLMEDTRGITAIDDRGVQAVCVLDTWTATCCQIHIWIHNPMVLRHGFAEEVFDFVFDSGRIKIIGQTPSDNAKALKFIKHIGFEELFIVKDAIDIGVDIVVTEFTKERYYGRKSLKDRSKKRRDSAV